MKKQPLEFDRLRALLTYDQQTGEFKWNPKTPRSKAMKIAGCINDRGYRVIRVDNILIGAHRLAWLYSYQEWPMMEVDHINGNRSDNRLINLRLVSHAGNAQNMRGAMRTSKTGLLGAHPHQGKWMAKIKIFGEQKYLGMFDSPEEAHAAYVKAKRIYHATCTI
jgi:HNH endonuclease